MDIKQLMQMDHTHVWHPYSAMDSDIDVYPVVSADGVRLTLADGRELIDGMSSWWCAIHGYNHPVMNRAIQDQLEAMSHVMFGGLTHHPAVELAAKLVEITPDPLKKVFFSDSGSVAVEVAMKMAIQYWNTKHAPEKQNFLTVCGGYHGDTFGAMSVSDPITGMHTLFKDALQKQYFADIPSCRFGEPCTDDDIASFEKLLAKNHQLIAATILEPIVQGAGGMRFYSAEYLYRVRELCDRYDVLLILDEIATGFGRSGKLFACEHADIAPDIMCVGKALTGGYLTLAATITTKDVSSTIDQGNPGVFMHGPTFMANPLACSAGIASIDLLLDSPWQEKIANIEKKLKTGLEPCREFKHVADVRILGAIGVVELYKAVDMKAIQPMFVQEGVWIRPFGKLIYLMPPYNINDADIDRLTHAIHSIVANLA